MTPPLVFFLTVRLSILETSPSKVCTQSELLITVIMELQRLMPWLAEPQFPKHNNIYLTLSYMCDMCKMIRTVD